MYAPLALESVVRGQHDDINPDKCIASQGQVDRLAVMCKNVQVQDDFVVPSLKRSPHSPLW